MTGSETDPTLDIFLLLKNNWTLTGDLTGSSIGWGTGFYNEKIVLPQIVVNQPGGDPSPALTMGSTSAYFLDTDLVNVGVWVRPKQDSNTNLGWAKNAFFQMRKECERIIRSGSVLGSGSNGTTYRFAYLGSWVNSPMLDKKPTLLYALAQVKIVKTVRGV
jgi:hypothetical protein